MLQPVVTRPCLLLGAALFLLSGCSEAPASPVEADPEVASSALAQAQDEDEPEPKGPPVEFADLEMFLEFNSTDNDLGVQVALDAEDWDRVRAWGPYGGKVLDLKAQRELGDLGLTELRFESAEPSPAEVLGSIPPGEYEFSGRTVEGGRLVGSAELSHELPPAPVFTPEDGDVVDSGNTVIEWVPIAGLAGYEVIVANEDSDLELFVILGPETTRFPVPAEFMESGAEYKAEVLAIAENGNKTITEHVFCTFE